MMALTMIGYTTLYRDKSVQPVLANKTVMLVMEQLRALSEVQVKALQTLCLLKLHSGLFKRDVSGANMIYWKAARQGMIG